MSAVDFQASAVGGVRRALGLVEDAAAVTAGVVTVAVMLFVSADALMRYLLNSPLTFQYYLTENYLMVAMLTLPLAWAFRTGGYIRIQAFSQMLPTQGRDLLLRLGLVTSAFYVGALTWASWLQFVETFESREVDFGVIDWPVWISWIWVPIGCGLLTLRLVLTAIGPTKYLTVSHEPTEEGL